ncbi:MoxR-like ATPase [Tangfeifania diversioriginum]|uniref:MoxR-like ATPase n=1 Tax=Tangfeifania diversioriginum TaxID=1168035 RepID=A0A1M6J708_9BACT|nr:AAA family ATPase [Tangfeifania diversioriginum]SHJ42513.1 MoxR-like ATPase [Tangfeifania diversioriginum]
MEFKNDVEALDGLRDKFSELKKEITRVIYGQDEIITQVMVSLFSRGHVLLIGVPGLAKTLMVTTIAKILGLNYSRIQFTPDLMPSDIIGTEILDKERQFKFIKGPLFANIILADEINRTPPKTQSALLEAMQERAITAAGQRFELESPFFVLATQNPIEQEGTYPLPEAQLDRFMFSVWLDYPKYDDEITIVKNTTSNLTFDLKPVISAKEILYYQDLIRKIPINDNVLNYAVTLAAKTRPGNGMAADVSEQYLKWGAGPRASQYLVVGAKTHAALRGKYSPDIEDVQAVAPSILRHRIIKNYKAEAENISVEQIIEKLV